tara:strand:+ start:12728 stop:13189 length:462 start_codon:yes stop_codon:yes gene_type:complete
MEIRLAKFEDLKHILPLFKELDVKHIENNRDMKPVIKNERYKFLFMNVFKENSDFVLVVAEFENIIIGFALAKIIRIKNSLVYKDLSIGEILYVAVDQNHKRKGVGKKIILEIEKMLINKDVNKLEIRVYDFNEEMIPEKIDYKPKLTVYEKY